MKQKILYLLLPYLVMLVTLLYDSDLFFILFMTLSIAYIVMHPTIIAYARGKPTLEAMAFNSKGVFLIIFAFLISGKLKGPYSYQMIIFYLLFLPGLFMFTISCTYTGSPSQVLKYLFNLAKKRKRLKEDS